MQHNNILRWDIINVPMYIFYDPSHGGGDCKLLQHCNGSEGDLRPTVKNQYMLRG